MKGKLLIEDIVKLSNNKVSFHMPGHKNGSIYGEEAYKYLKDISKIDITEIDGADNMFEPEGIIKDALDRAKEYYQTKSSYFLINGTTAGIISMIMSITEPGDKIIIQRDCHKSIINSLILGDLQPVYIYPEYDKNSDITLGISPKDLETLLLTNKDIKGIVLTYPSYYGLCSDIKALVELAHKHDKIVLVDGAHEAHFKLSNLLPVSALEVGADIVVHSTHKTLPSLTQSSMLHVNSDRINISKLEKMLSIHQSSSPSYILMSSLDSAINIIANNGEKLVSNLFDYIKDFKEKIGHLTGVRLLNRELISSDNIIDLDETKIMLEIEGYKGIDIAKELKYRDINVELYTSKYVLILATIGNTRYDFDLLYKAIKDISNIGNKISNRTENNYKNYDIKPQIALNPRDAFYSRTEVLKLENSSGRISGEYITPYPPGIPLVSPGELITEDIIDYIREIQIRGINIIGPEDTTLDTINVVKEKR